MHTYLTDSYFRFINVFSRTVCLPVTTICSQNVGLILIQLHTNNVIYNSRVHFTQVLKILIEWRHNGFWGIFFGGTLQSSIFMFIFFQISRLCSPVYEIIKDCKPAFSVNLLNSIWPTKTVKMTVMIKYFVKRKT